ncbi:putative Ig domain-containing protein, partial [Pelagicoccus enzymogenes]|uniref:putative Ig domain-containing protein n=1 Tax=Pelagicoccus enzymogenes TaxID=2773457 RepID=UPI00280C6208
MSFRFTHTGDSSAPTPYELSNGQSLDFNAGDSLKLTNPDDIADMIPQGHDVLVMTKDGSSYLLKNFLLTDATELELPDGTTITADSFRQSEANDAAGADHASLQAINFEPEDATGSVVLQSVTLLSLISALSQNTSAFDEFKLNADGSENQELRNYFQSLTLAALGKSESDQEHAQVAELSTQENQQAYYSSSTSQTRDSQSSAQTKSAASDDGANTRSVSIDVTDTIEASQLLDIERFRFTAVVVNGDGDIVESTTEVNQETGTVEVVIDLQEEDAGQQVEIEVIVTDPENNDRVIDRNELTVVLPDPFNEENVTLSLSGNDIIENEAGYAIGSLEALGSEKEIEGPFTYSIASDPSGLFEIEGSTLKLKDGVTIDFETAPESYSLSLRIENEDGSQVERTLTLHPADANDAPEVSGMGLEGTEDTAIPFERETFEQAFSDVDNDDTLESVRIDSLPANGALTVAGEPVEIGQIIPVEQISDVAFQPNSDWNGHTEFLWSGFDGAAWSDQAATVSIDIENVNDTPLATFSIATQTANEDAAFTFTLPEGLFTDSDIGDSLTLSAALPDWLNFDPITGEISGVPSYENLGEHRIEITATDASGAKTSTAFTLEVENVNDRPTFTQIQDVSIGEYDPIDIAAGSYFSDEDAEFGDTLSFTASLADGSELPEWLTIDESTGKIAGNPPQGQNTDLDIRVTATDSEGESVSSTFALHVENQNDAPELDSPIADQSADEDSEFSFNIASNFRDSDLGDQLTYTATLPDGSDLPEWLNFDTATGQFSGIPTNDDVGMLTLQVTASDGSQSVDDFFAIMVDNTNDKPVATALVDQTVEEDSGFSLDVSDAFSDVDAGDTLTYSATQMNGSELPEWLEFDEGTGKFSGTPANEDVGSLSILVVASDGQENANAIFSIEVENTNDGPVATFIPEQTTEEDAPFLFDVSDAFSDEDIGDELSYSATLEDGSELPEWLNINPRTGELSGTPLNANVGELNLKVSASDGQESASTTLKITIENTNDGPFVSAGIEDVTTAEDAAFTLDVSSNFGDPDFFDTLEFSAALEDGSPLPQWLSFDPFTASFSGTPTNNDVGSLSVRVVAQDGETSISDVFSIEVQNTNDAPTVTTDFVPVNAEEDSAFTYDAASHFEDTDASDSLTYTATLSDGSDLPSWISIDPITGELSGIPENQDVGSINITVTATDVSGETASGTFTLTVENTNDGPVASAIAQQSTEEDAAFSLDASVAFDDVDAGDALTYSATLENGDSLPSWLTIDSQTGTLAGTPHNSDVGTISVTVRASDGEANAEATFTLEIQNTNDGPTVTNSIQNVTTLEDASFVFEASNHFGDADTGDVLSYSATLQDGSPLPDWLAIDPETGKISGQPGNDDIGTISLIVSATDQAGSTASDSFALTVENTNDGPTASLEIEAQEVLEDSGYNLSLADYFDDIDTGDALSYSAELADGSPLPDWLAIDSQTGRLSGTPRNNDVGELEIKVIASDGEAEAQQTFTLSVENTNDGPVLKADFSNENTLEDENFILDASENFHDADLGDTLTYSATLQNGDPLPDWLSLDASTGKFSGVPLNEHVGSISITVSASDGSEAVSESFSLTVFNTNDAPLVEWLNDNQNIVEDELFNLDASNIFFDVDEGDTLTYSATLENGDPLPDWMSIDPLTGQLSGTPTNADVGEITILLSASDGEATTSKSFSLYIENTNDGPVVTTNIADQSIDEDNEFSLDISENFADEDIGDSLTFSATLEDGSPLPNWISIDSESGQLSGTPRGTDVGELSIVVTASDGEASVSDTFTLTIENTNDGPVVTHAISDQSVDEDSAFSLDLSSNFADQDIGDTLTYTATLANGDPLPAWLILDPASGQISGTPGNSDVGEIEITVTASDGEASVSDSFTLSVENTNDGPTVTTSINDTTTKEDNAFTLDTSNNFHDPDLSDTLSYTATLENGDPLPQWLQIDSESGQLTGTPRNSDVGNIAVRVTASDGESSASDVFTITVENTNDAIVVSSNVADQNIDEDSTFTLDISGNFKDLDQEDTLTYSATLENGEPLPNWLTIDPETGIFSGTPLNEDAGELSITITATDSAGSTASDTFSLEVENTNDGPTASVIADQSTDEDSAFSLDASTSFEDIDAGDTLTYSATLENGDPLPSWLSIDSET